MYYIVVRFR